MEPRLLPVWQCLQKALCRRDSWFRHSRLDPASQAAWDRKLSLTSDKIDAYRRSCIQALKPVFEETLAELISLDDLTLGYYRGRDRDRDLLGILAFSLLRDQQMDCAQTRPQRADLHIRLTGHNAVETLSRGRQKLVVCALCIAQGHLIDRARRGQCVYPAGDLPSELDKQHRMALCRLPGDLGCQVLITCMNPQLLKDDWRTDTSISILRMEHGKVSQITTIGSKA